MMRGYSRAALLPRAATKAQSLANCTSFSQNNSEMTQAFKGSVSLTVPDTAMEGSPDELNQRLYTINLMNSARMVSEFLPPRHSHSLRWRSKLTFTPLKRARRRLVYDQKLSMPLIWTGPSVNGVALLAVFLDAEVLIVADIHQAVIAAAHHRS